MGALPADFLFGVSTASYQIEGAVDADGRGRSVWDDFCERPGAIVDGSSGEVACDSYHRYAEDVALIAGVGAGAYRFSIAWPRVIPAGTGAVNQAGLDYYDRLVDALCAADVTPCATLFHWDLPSPLEAAGGWLNRETVSAFAAYVEVVAARLADRVAMWCPVNEPNVVTMLGYGSGVHAPGKSLGVAALPVAHHLLLGHGRAVAALRAAGAGQVGSANNHSPVWPRSQDAADVAGARFYDLLHNRLFAEPMLLGSYPERIEAMMPGVVGTADLDEIAAPLDFYGLNYYNPTRVGAPGAGGVAGLTDLPGLPFTVHPIEGYPRTDFDWPVVPDGLRELLVQLSQRYGERLPPMFVTENGCAYAVAPDAHGRAADRERIAYQDHHLAAVAQARAEGARVDGYFCWSLLDNFEWAEGYTKRFGLVHVDFATLARTPRDSYGWYRDYIGATRAGPPSA